MPPAACRFGRIVCPVLATPTRFPIGFKPCRWSLRYRFHKADSPARGLCLPKCPYFAWFPWKRISAMAPGLLPDSAAWLLAIILKGDSLQRTAVRLIVLALLLTSTNLAQAEPPVLQPVYRTQSFLFIPYQPRQQGPAGQGTANKVQLLLSRDGLSDWKILQEARPNVQGFSFRAAGDGHYWFAVRVSGQRTEPLLNVQPQMHLIVDTLKPQLTLSATTEADGKVVVRYEARDQNLRGGKVMLEVETNREQPIILKLDQPDVSQPDRLVGRSHWTPPPGVRGARLRGTIEDCAGHRTQAFAQIDSAGPTLPEFPNTQERVPPAGSLLADTANPAPRPGGSLSRQNWPPDDTAPAVVPSVNPTAPNANVSITPPELVFDTRSPISPTDGNQGGWDPTSQAFLQANSRSINSGTFDVDYEVAGVGPWGVAKVELWGTADGGKSWNSFGVDADNRSPIRATVPNSGTYGFRILVDSANGVGSVPPRQGDQPELVVHVDLQPPTAQLTGAEVGREGQQSQLSIRWTATDTNLEMRPIGLFFSSHPDGPWATIAAGLENTGDYVWPLERHVPNQFFLRLEARDRAGNVTTHQTTSPLVLYRPQPVGRLRSVRPVRDTPSRSRTAGR